LEPPLFVRHRSVLVALVAICVAGDGTALGAQRPDSTVDLTFFRPTDLLWVGGFALASYGVSRFDPRIAQYFQRPSAQDDAAKRNFAENFTKLQETSLTLAGVATYGIGKLSKSRTVADIGLHVTEAVVAASVTSQIIRGPMGRSRPEVTNFEDQYDFHPFAGFTQFKFRAYPSIHTSSSFAAATVLTLETARRNPRATWVVAPLTYLLASTPAYSRMYLGQHWASDIFMGAFFGVFYGARVVDYSHDHPDNRFDRFFLGREPTEGIRLDYRSGRGATLSYGLTF
jgi:membrane-associated phospholipid phosphatase